jgi:hypothetical protein
MAVEVKSCLEKYDINQHVKRLNLLRKYMDNHGDARKLLGAMAAGSYMPGAKEYAEENGLYVILQSGESVTVSEEPGEFEAKIW